MSRQTDEPSRTPGEILDGGRVAVLDPAAIEEGRLAARERSHIGARTEPSEDDGDSEPVTRQIVVARLSVLEDARTRMLDELAVLQGKIMGLHEILSENQD